MVNVTDQHEIEQMLTRYTLAVDTADWALLDTVFQPDAVIDYTASGGIKGDYPTVKAWLADVLPRYFPARLHLLGQVHVAARSDDEAAVTAYFYNPMTLAGADRTPVEFAGFYHHVTVRTAEGWRSRELREEIVFTRGLAG